MSEAGYLVVLVAAHPFTLLAGVVVGIAFVWLLASAVRIARQFERAVVFRLGRYVRTAGPGLFLVIPFVETAVRVDMRTTTIQDIEQESITKDNVPVKVNVVLQYRITDAVRSIVEVSAVGNAVMQLALVTLREKVGRHNLDETLKDQEKMSGEMLAAIKDATDKWGVAIERIQMKNVEIPETMQRAMAQEAEALREQRARVIKAEGEKQGAQLLKEAADLVTANPAALELRRMQMITEVGAEQNTSTIIMIPSEFVSMAHGVARLGELFERRMPSAEPGTAA